MPGAATATATAATVVVVVVVLEIFSLCRSYYCEHYLTERTEYIMFKLSRDSRLLSVEMEVRLVITITLKT